MSPDTIVIELSSGLMWLISLGLFWIGACFVAGMRRFGSDSIQEFKQAIEELKKLEQDLRR